MTEKVIVQASYFNNKNYLRRQEKKRYICQGTCDWLEAMESVLNKFPITYDIIIDFHNYENSYKQKIIAGESLLISKDAVEIRNGNPIRRGLHPRIYNLENKNVSVHNRVAGVTFAFKHTNIEVKNDNTDSASTFLKEVYSLFPVLISSDRHLKNIDFCGLFFTVSKVSPEDHFTGYKHSHFPRSINNSLQLHKPCLGSGPIIPAISDFMQASSKLFIETKNVSPNSAFTLKKEKKKIISKVAATFFNVYAKICQYLATESLTGGPYYNIESKKKDFLRKFKNPILTPNLFYQNANTFPEMLIYLDTLYHLQKFLWKDPFEEDIQEESMEKGYHLVRLGNGDIGIPYYLAHDLLTKIICRVEKAYHFMCKYKELWIIWPDMEEEGVYDTFSHLIFEYFSSDPQYDWQFSEEEFEDIFPILHTKFFEKDFCNFNEKFFTKRYIFQSSDENINADLINNYFHLPSNNLDQDITKELSNESFNLMPGTPYFRHISEQYKEKKFLLFKKTKVVYEVEHIAENKENHQIDENTLSYDPFLYKYFFNLITKSINNATNRNS